MIDDPLVTAPTTDLNTGNWDADGPLVGVRVAPDSSSIYDHIIESDWEHAGCRCFLIRVTKYHALGNHAGPERIGEAETFYRGYVHAPDIDSLPKGCYGTTIVNCNPDHGWFAWDERAWRNGYARGKSVSDHAHRKTERLAEAAAARREDEI
jgi:hypothetical protein